jgi:putative hydrolase of the HAD superfamily
MDRTGSGGSPGKAILIDLGGVLSSGYLSAAIADWAARLGITGQEFRAALYAGSDDQVLIGRMSEPAWWRLVAQRLGVTEAVLAELRRDGAAREEWDHALLALLRRLRGRARTAVVSNAWPGARARLADAGILDVADEFVLSGEVGCAKPDARIYLTALDRLHADPADALFIDDQPRNVAAAIALGITGHQHTDSPSTIARIRTFLPSAPD